MKALHFLTVPTMSLFITASLFFGCSNNSEYVTTTQGEVAWAVGTSDENGIATIYNSLDSGKTWHLLSSDTTMLNGFDAQDLYVFSKNDVWIVGSNHTLIHTEDSGISWEKFDTFTDINESQTFYDISALSPSNFWISGDNGVLLHTQDAAQHWEHIDPAQFNYGTIEEVSVVDTQTLYVVGKNRDFSGGFVYKSEDNGVTWKSIDTIGSEYAWSGVESIDENHTIIYGEKGNYVTSDDRGKTWINSTINEEDINDIVMLSTEEWWSAADFENIYFTSDSGVNWNKQESDNKTNMHFYSIDILDNQTAVIIGSNETSGKILLTRDGGETWKLQQTTDTPLYKVSYVHPLTISLESENQTRKIFSAIISTSLEGLEDAATGEIGGFLIGLVLREVGWGEEGSDVDNKLLQSMNTKLDNIVSELTVIKQDIDKLAQQLKIKMDSIDQDILDPTDAITDIDTTHDEFIDHFGYLQAGEGNQTKIYDFIDEHIVNNYHIENDVMSIYHSVIPPDSAKTPALKNFREYLDDSYMNYNGSLTDAYYMLELYTSQLVINQIKGVNLVVEAKGIEDGNASVQRYMDTYNAYLQEMVSNLYNGKSFISNAYTLALSHVNPIPYKTNDVYISDEIKQFLKRAFFYKNQTTNKKLPEANILLFETLDSNSSNKDFYIKNDLSSVGSYSKFECSDRAVIDGHIYTNWDTEESITSKTSYNVYECAVTDKVAVGEYKVFKVADDTSEVLTTLQVDNYDVNYTLQEDGNYTYGHQVLFHTTMLNHFSKNSSLWTPYTKDLDCAHTTGSTPWGSGIKGSTSCQDYYRGYSGLYELRSDITYKGSNEERLSVHYSAKFHLLTKTPYYGNSSYARAHFGIWDITTDTEVSSKCSPFYSYSHTGKANHDKDAYRYPKGVCSFSAKPDHKYRIYFSMKVEGSGDDYDGTESSIYVDEINYIYLTF